MSNASGCYPAVKSYQDHQNSQREQLWTLVNFQVGGLFPCDMTHGCAIMLSNSHGLGCQMMPNLANIAKYYCFPTNLSTFLAICFMPKFCHFENTNCQHWQNNPFWIFYQMHTQILERKYSLTLIVVNYQSDHFPISSKQSYYLQVLCFTVELEFNC